MTKKQFFKSFYDNFDPRLNGAFDKNTNMSAYFVSFFKSTYFNNLLQACLDEPSIISSYYQIDKIKNQFLPTSACSDQLLDVYDFFLYKFVKMWLMLK